MYTLNWSGKLWLALQPTNHFILYTTTEKTVEHCRFDYNHSAHSVNRGPETARLYLLELFSSVCVGSSIPAKVDFCSLHTTQGHFLTKTHVPLKTQLPAASLCSAFQLCQFRKRIPKGSRTPAHFLKKAFHIILFLRCFLTELPSKTCGAECNFVPI